MNFDSLVNWGEVVFLTIFATLYFGVPAFLVWASYCEKCSVDLRELWTHNNRPDKLAVIILGTWWVHTCSVILWSLSRTVTSQDFVIYGGWAIPIIAKMYAPSSATNQADNKEPK